MKVLSVNVGSSTLKFRLYEMTEEKVKLAFDMYTNKIVDYITKYFVKLNGEVAAICFTADGGENESIIRGET